MSRIFMRGTLSECTASAVYLSVGLALLRASRCRNPSPPVAPPMRPNADQEMGVAGNKS